ncbi:MAG: electron transfer flavoprotein-ubiquinone oxidoreductase [Thermoanaerobaculia bacterium]
MAPDTIERDTLDLDVVFVGAGPAGLAGAYHLSRLISEHNRQHKDKALEVSIAVLEKGKEVGSHLLSGAVVDPRSLKELFPDSWQEAPFEAPVPHEKLLWLTSSGSFSLPIPPPLNNHGKYVASLGRLCKWLGGKVESAGVDLFTEFPASEVLLEGERVVGVRTGDRGLGKDGQPKANFEPGVDIKTRCVVLAEGVRGTLAKQLEGRLGLTQGKNPQIYALGIKEIWQLPAGRLAPGEVIHTMNWPLGFSNFGGGFIYGMKEDQAIVGLVVGLDYENPHLDPHAEHQRFKTHPWLRKLLAGGSLVAYGAKALPEGGWFSMPRLSGDGFLITGDSGGFLNSQRLKGVHLAIKSGMLAAETVFEGLLADDLGPTALARYREKVEASWVKEELWGVRNFHQAFDRGLLGGLVQGAAGLLTGGRGWGFKNRLGTHPGHERMVALDSAAGRSLEPPAPVAFDRQLTFDKLTDVYHSGAAHHEDQPVHLLVADTSICVDRCAREFANPCQRFCPANVYEMVDEPSAPSGRRLQINASNCVHCKTCDILDPYAQITWVPPEGGGGPSYGRM